MNYFSCSFITGGKSRFEMGLDYGLVLVVAKLAERQTPKSAGYVGLVVTLQYI